MKKTRKKKILASSVVAPMVISSVPLPFNTESAEAATVYEIRTVQDLLNIKNNLSGNYVLMNDIDLTGVNWTPINNFTGTLDGNGHTISNLTINNTANNQGLFGSISGSVKNLKLTNVNITGGNGVGALAANSSGVIENVAVIGGTVKGSSNVGGLFGLVTGGTIQKAFSTANVEGTSSSGSVTGGLIGSLSPSSTVTVTIQDVYTTGSVKGYSQTGGIVGSATNRFQLKNAYSTSVVNGTSQVGGIFGSAYSTGTITNIFALNPFVSGQSNVGKIMGSGSVTFSNTNVPETSNGFVSLGFISNLLTNEQVTQQSTYNTFDFTNTWQMDEQTGLPVLKFAPVSGSQPVLGTEKEMMFKDGKIYTLIRNKADLNNIRNAPNNYYLLLNDIDLTGVNWTPINGFTGTLDGNGYSISNLTINNASGNSQGLFGSISGSVKNLKLTNVNITGGNGVGALAANSSGVIENVAVIGGTVKGSSNVGGLFGLVTGGTIQKVFSTANVEGTSSSGSATGGLIGSLSPTTTITVQDVYTTGSVKGYSQTGGIIGSTSSSFQLKNAYSTSAVNGTYSVGGIIGYSSGGLITNIYALNSSVNGQSNVGKIIGTGAISGYGSTTFSNTYVPETSNGFMSPAFISNLLTNEQVTQQSTYNTFDFTNTWQMDEQTGLPVLKFAPVSGSRPVLGTEKVMMFKDGKICTLIRNKADLNNIRNAPSNYYMLVNDIDLTGENWTPINGFTGTLDGNGHTISNLTINNTSIGNQGLFNTLGGSVKNLKLTNVNITGGNGAGALAGNFNGLLIENVAVIGGTVKGSSNVGGLLGQASGGTIQKVFSTANVEGTSSSGSATGGLIGSIYNSFITIQDVYTTGSVKGYSQTGGIIGSTSSSFQLKNAYSTSAVNGTYSVGGIIGYSSGGLITNIYALNSSVNGQSYVGKIIGSGAISGYGSTTFSNTFALSTMSGNGNDNFKTGQVTVADSLKEQTYSFYGFDFGTLTGNPVWKIDEGKTLPYLASLPYKVAYDSSTGGYVTGSNNNIPTLNNKIQGKTIYQNDSPQLQIDLTNVFSDADGDALSYSIVSGNTNVATASVNNGILTVNGVNEGTTTITVTADDGNGGTVQDTFTVQVIQDTPVVEFTKNTFTFASVPNATEYIILRNGVEIARIPANGSTMYSYTDTNLTPGETYSYDVQPVYATGEGTPIEIGTFETLSMNITTMMNQNDVTVSWTPISEAQGYRVIFKDSNGQVVSSQEVASNVTSVTKTFASAGNYVVEITPKLNGVYGEGQTDSFTIVQQENQIPTSTPIPNQTLKVTDSPKTIDVKNYFTDADGDTLTFSVQANNGNVTVSNNGSQVTITPKAVGTSTITVTADDGNGGTVQQTFTVTVQEVAPAAVQNLQVVANSYNQVAITFSPVANADEYIIKRNGQEVARITGTSYTDNNVVAETTYNYEVIAVNEAGQSAPASMNVVTPKKPNTAPTASAIPNQTLKVTDSPKTIDVKNYFTDADGDTLTFSVQANNGNVTVSNNGSQVTITPKAVGTSTITVTADDGHGGTVQQTFTVTVQEVVPAAVQNLQVVANSYNQVTVTFSPVANADEYIIKRNGQEVTRITGTSYVDNNVTADTTYNYEVIAVNEAGQSTPASMSVVTPKKPNTAPTASAIPNQTLKVTDSPKIIDVKNYFSDADGDTLTFSVQANNGNVTVSNNGSQVTITPKAVGTSTITVTANDGHGGTVQQTFTVTVQEVAPSTVQNIQVSLNGTKATVTWDAFPNATGYRVQRYVKNSDGQFAKDGFARSVTGTSYEDTTLAEGKEYQYEITPKTNVYLTGSAGMSAPVVVPSTTPEEPPTGGGDNGTTAPSLQVQVNGSTVQVTWPAMEGVDRYRVERFKKDANGQYARDGVAKSVSETTVTETLPNGEYKFVITPRVGYVYDTTKAMEGFGTVGGTSTGGGGSTTSPATTFVPNVHAIVKGTKVTLQWDSFMVGQQAAEYYRVVRYVKDEQGQFVQDGPTRTVNGTRFEDTLAANKEYRYEVIPRGTTTYLFDKATKVSLTALAEGESKVFVADYVLSDGRTQYEVQRYVKDTTTGQYVTDGQPFTVNQLSFVDPNPIDVNKEYKYTFK